MVAINPATHPVNPPVAPIPEPTPVAQVDVPVDQLELTQGPPPPPPPPDTAPDQRINVVVQTVVQIASEHPDATIEEQVQLSMERLRELGLEITTELQTALQEGFQAIEEIGVRDFVVQLVGEAALNAPPPVSEETLAALQPELEYPAGTTPTTFAEAAASQPWLSPGSLQMLTAQSLTVDADGNLVDAAAAEREILTRLSEIDWNDGAAVAQMYADIAATADVGGLELNITTPEVLESRLAAQQRRLRDAHKEDRYDIRQEGSGDRGYDQFLRMMRKGDLLETMQAHGAPEGAHAFIMAGEDRQAQYVRFTQVMGTQTLAETLSRQSLTPEELALALDAYVPALAHPEFDWNDPEQLAAAETEIAQHLGSFRFDDARFEPGPALDELFGEQGRAVHDALVAEHGTLDAALEAISLPDDVRQFVLAGEGATEQRERFAQFHRIDAGAKQLAAEHANFRAHTSDRPDFNMVVTNPGQDNESTRRAYFANPPGTRPAGDGLIMWVDSAVDRHIEFGQMQGVLTDEVLADIDRVASVIVPEDSEMGPVDGAALTLALLARVPGERLTPSNQAQLAGALNYINSAPDVATQRDRVADVLAAYVTMDRAGSPALSQQDAYEDLSFIWNDIGDIGERDPRAVTSMYNIIASVSGIPGDHKFETRRGELKIHNDDNGVTQDLDWEFHDRDFGDFLLAALPFVLPVVGLAGGAIGAAANMVGRGIALYNAIENDDALGILGASLGFANATLNFGSTVSSGVQTISALQTGEQIVGTIAALDSGDPLAIVNAVAGFHDDPQLHMALSGVNFVNAIVHNNGPGASGALAGFAAAYERYEREQGGIEASPLVDNQAVEVATDQAGRFVRVGELTMQVQEDGSLVDPENGKSPFVFPAFLGEDGSIIDGFGKPIVASRFVVVTDTPSTAELVEGELLADTGLPTDPGTLDSPVGLDDQAGVMNIAAAEELLGVSFSDEPGAFFEQCVATATTGDNLELGNLCIMARQDMLERGIMPDPASAQALNNYANQRLMDGVVAIIEDPSRATEIVTPEFLRLAEMAGHLGSAMVDPGVVDLTITALRMANFSQEASFIQQLASQNVGGPFEPGEGRGFSDGAVQAFVDAGGEAADAVRMMWDLATDPAQRAAFAQNVEAIVAALQTEEGRAQILNALKEEFSEELVEAFEKFGDDPSYYAGYLAGTLAAGGLVGAFFKVGGLALRLGGRSLDTPDGDNPEWADEVFDPVEQALMTKAHSDFLMRYPHASGAQALTPLQFTRAFGPGPYSPGLADLAARPDFAQFVAEHPSQASLLYRGLRNLPHAWVQAQLNNSNNNLLALAHDFGQRLPEARPVAVHTEGGELTMRLTHAPLGADYPALRLGPGDPGIDHNGAFMTHVRTDTGPDGKPVGVYDSLPRDYLWVRPEQLRLDGQPGTSADFQRTAFFGAHGHPNGFGGLSTAEAARAMARQIADFKAQYPDRDPIENVVLESCHQGTRRNDSVYLTNAQEFDEILNDELINLNHPPVRTLAAENGGVLYGGSFYQDVSGPHPGAPATFVPAYDQLAGLSPDQLAVYNGPNTAAKQALLFALFTSTLTYTIVEQPEA